MADQRGKKRSADEAFLKDPKDPKFDLIAPDGDVVFVLNNGDTRVRVQSAIMKNASPVFFTILSPGFKDKRAPGAGSGAPVRVRLSEDNEVAFWWICRVLHSQADTKVWEPTLRELVQVMNVAKKYDPTKAIQISVKFWIDRHLPPANSCAVDMLSLSLACYQACDEGALKSATSLLLLTYSGSFIGLAKDVESGTSEPDSGRILYKLAGTLEEIRTALLFELSQLFYVELPKALRESPCKNPGAPEATSAAILKVHEGSELLDEYHNSSIKSLMESASDALLKLFITSCCKDCAELRAGVHRSFRDTITRLKDDVKGLCVACFNQRGDWECEVNHTCV